jgi:hypothetical protein
LISGANAAVQRSVQLAASTVAFVARGSKPAAGEAKRSGDPDYDLKNRQRGGGDEYNKRFVGEFTSARLGRKALRCPR